MPANWPWLKWCKGLRNKPEVFRMSALLGIDRDHVAGKLMRLWEWCDDNVTESNVDGSGWATLRLASNPEASCAALDAIVELGGFASAMRHAGWLKTRGASIRFPNYSRHNGPTAKARARNSLNQALKRQQLEGVSPDDGDEIVTRGEERREKDNPPPPPKNGALGGQRRLCARTGNAEGEEEVLFRLRMMDVNEAKTAIDAARAAGVSTADIHAILDYAESKPGAYGPGAVYRRVLTAVPGIPPEKGWQKVSQQYAEREAMAKQESQREAARVEHESARRESEACRGDPLAVFTQQQRQRVATMSREDICGLLSGNPAAGVYRRRGLTHSVCWALSEAMRAEVGP